MGIDNSKVSSQLKSQNILINKPAISQNSDQQENIKKSQIPKPFQNLNQRHRQILNIAITTAFKRFQSDEFAKAQQQQKSILSSLNRYYEQNKKKHAQVDEENMTEKDYEVLLKTLRNHQLFKELFEIVSLQKDFIMLLLASVKKRTFESKQYIYKQFDPPSNFYMITEGRLSIQLNSTGLRLISKGDYFGLQSIIYDSEQGQSIKVKSQKAILYEISNQQIIKVKNKINNKNKQQIHDFLQQKVNFFNFLDNKQKENLLLQTVRLTYSKGQIIFEKDYDANSFFVIKKGSVLIKTPQKKDLILEAGRSFGEGSFFQTKAQRQGKAVAYENNSVIYGIGSKAIFKSLGNKLDCAVLKNLQKQALLRDSKLNQLYLKYHFDIEKVLNKFKLRKCQKYEVLATKGQPADKIFINVRNQINFKKELIVFNSCIIQRLIQKYLNSKSKKIEIKQDDSLLQQMERRKIYYQESEQVYQQDVIVTQRGNCAVASIIQVFYLMVEAIEYPEKHKQQSCKIELSVKNIHKYAKISFRNEITTILAVQENFEIQMIVKIYPKNNNYNKFFCFNRSVNMFDPKSYSFTQSSQVKNNISFYRQIQIIQSLNYPNICGFYKAEQDWQNIYFILQYLKAVTLQQVRQELGIMPYIVIKYYILKIALILDYLHKNNVLYRNLTPEKVLIDNKGFPNIYDFKLSKKLNETNNFRTSTIVGTPHYISPEAILKKSYSFESDFWQLGVLLYELIYQELPFANNQDDPIVIFSQIIQNEPKFKKQNSSLALKGLLQKNPSKRIKNFNQLIKQPFFQNYDWEMIENNKMKPPFISKKKTKRFQNIKFFIRNGSQ